MRRVHILSPASPEKPTTVGMQVKGLSFVCVCVPFARTSSPSTTYFAIMEISLCVCDCVVCRFATESAPVAMHVFYSLTVLKDIRHESTLKVKPKHLNCPLMVGCRMLHKLP